MLSLFDSLPLRGEILLRHGPLRISLPCLPQTLVQNLDAWCQEDFPISARTCIERPWYFFGDNTSRPGVWYYRIRWSFISWAWSCIRYFFPYIFIIEFTLQSRNSSRSVHRSSRLSLKNVCVCIVRTFGLSVLLVYYITNSWFFSLYCRPLW